MDGGAPLQPDLADPLGVRDRSMLELLYSTGMRRSELTGLELTAVNQERRTAQVRKGKGRKDRVVPVGERALQWLERYLCEVRPLLVVDSLQRENAFNGVNLLHGYTQVRILSPTSLIYGHEKEI
jgi:site-specific recombinase XerD